MNRKIQNIEAVIKKYEKDLMSCEMIAKEIGCTRQAVFKVLRRAGVDTSDRKRETFCDQCGKSIFRTRGQVRDRLRHFCSYDCYFKFIKNSHFQESRQGQRIGRRVIENIATIPGFVVHHVDGDDLNNEPFNLWAFKNQADHGRYHRGGQTEAFIVSERRWLKVQKRCEKN